MKRPTKLIIPALLLSLVLLTSCQIKPVNQYFLGNVYEKAVTFPVGVDTPQDKSWETFELSLNFTYDTKTDLHVLGTAQLGNHYQMMYDRLNRLYVYLFFLDDSQTVIQTNRIVEVLQIDTDRKITFEQRLPIPAHATSIAFGYEGFTRSGEPGSMGGGTDWFSKLPL